MATLDMTAAQAALKEYYDDQSVENLAYDANPTLVMMPKDTEATGKYVPQPVIYETSQGGSANFANAQGNSTPMVLAEFLPSLVPDYQIAYLAQQAALASQNAKGGFINFAKEFVDVAIQASANRAALQLFRSGTGSRGQVSTTVAISTGVITLANAADVTNFGYNQTLQWSSTDGGAPTAALGYVIGRNVTAGTITVSATGLGGAAGTPALWTTSGFLLVQGDSNSNIKGFAAWLPAVAPVAGSSFWNVDRSFDSRLYGLYFDGSGEPVEEAIIDASLLNAREKGRPGHLITNFGTFSALGKAMGARREFVNLETDGGIRFRGFKIVGPNGDIDCFADRNCQGQAAWLLQMNTWKLLSLNPVPHIFRYGDGLEMLRVSNADASEVRCGYYAQPTCKAPGWNSQIRCGV